MKLYVCWGTFQIPGARSHPCRNAHQALEAAGHDPEVIRARGFGALPDITRGRKEVKQLSGQSWVPLLVTDEGEIVQGSDAIVTWAGANAEQASATA